MDGLRWLLLALGLLVIGGVYLYSRRASKSEPEAVDNRERREPTLDADGADDEPEFLEPLVPVIRDDDDADDDGDDGFEPDTDDEPDYDAVADEREAAPPAPQKIVTLRIIARGGKAFAGDALILNLRGIGMRHGKFGIFHRFDGANEDKSIFSAASLVEPGSFDLANIKDQQIPGISLFAVLPGPIDSVEAFDMLMAAARTLAQSLEGELLDESGSTLSIQRERYMREEVVQYQHRHKVA